MKPFDIADRRLLHQRISGGRFERPEQVVQWMGAVQAQDYQHALWAVGLRTINATRTDVEQALANRALVLTWPMRGTIHLVAAADVRWFLELCASRPLAASQTRRKQLELDDHILGRCEHLIRDALSGGARLTRAEIMKLLASTGIDPTGQRGYHILWSLAQTGLICFGPKRGKEQTFVLLEEWLPETRSLPRDQALVELTRRYFTSHGPATLKDFAGWTGLTLTEARAGLEAIRSELTNETNEGIEYWWADTVPGTPNSTGVYLLPGFDEYILGYKDRRDVLTAEHAQRVVPGGNGVFLPTIVADGQVVGTWKRDLKQKRLEVLLKPFTAQVGLHERAADAIERFRAFADQPQDSGA
jgi:Winged helix DNA-binding domain